MDLHSFTFPIADIQKRVEKETTYIGKMRSSDDEPGNYDRMRLTESEDFMFRDFLEQAAAETYDWIKAFGKTVQNAYQIIPDGNMHTIKENHGLRLSVNGETKDVVFSMPLWPMALENVAKPHAEVNFDVETDDYVSYSVIINPQIMVELGDALSIDCSVKIRCTTGVEDTPIEAKRILSKSMTISSDGLVNGITFDDVRIDKEAIGTFLLRSVNSIEFAVTAITAEASDTLPEGDFVEYIRTNGDKEYGRLIRDYVTGAPVVDKWGDKDMRNSITFTVELPEWTDRNMLPSVESHLAKALVFYIVSLWFEMTNPKESERYHEKWEEAARQAQLGLNTENKILQRHSHWL